MGWEVREIGGRGGEREGECGEERRKIRNKKQELEENKRRRSRN